MAPAWDQSVQSPQINAQLSAFFWGLLLGYCGQVTPACHGEILPVDRVKWRAAVAKRLALRNGNGNLSNMFGSSFPGMENETERGHTNNLCVKLSLLLLEAPAASIRQSLLSLRSVERCFCSGHGYFHAISLLLWQFAACFCDFLLYFHISSLFNIKRYTFPNDM